MIITSQYLDQVAGERADLKPMTAVPRASPSYLLRNGRREPRDLSMTSSVDTPWPRRPVQGRPQAWKMLEKVGLTMGGLGMNEGVPASTVMIRSNILGDLIAPVGSQVGRKVAVNNLSHS
ncbi:hypothetical protein NPX13_g4646 [Xylaria arbuscula]|uniref:Uncharacterized protein n=1 Tax=Xylaria arbuscula TaxID=114810 RepID=A0A9W8NFY9_9PEZI|nr:hypothetical protein NPX13_g4646 [Xylaria arbuscula]